MSTIDDPIDQNLHVVMVPGLFDHPSLYLYSGNVNKYTFFSRCIDHGISHSHSCIYAYYHTKLRPSLNPFIQAGQVKVLELRDQADQLSRWIRDQRSIAGNSGASPLQFVFDFSRFDDIDAILSAKEEILRDADSVPVSGLFALDIDGCPHELVAALSRDLPRIMVSIKGEHMLYLSNESPPFSTLEVVDQNTVDDIVKKMLEPLILTYLSKPVSGYDILREINERFNVMIPMARVYSYLYNLEDNGYLVTKSDGRSKIYIPTPEGAVFIDRRIREIHTVLQKIL